MNQKKLLNLWRERLLMQKLNETLIRVSVDTTVKPIEWDLWVRSTEKSPWAFLSGGTAPTISTARNLGLRAAEQWAARIVNTNIKVDMLTE